MSKAKLFDANFVTALGNAYKARDVADEKALLFGNMALELGLTAGMLENSSVTKCPADFREAVQGMWDIVYRLKFTAEEMKAYNTPANLKKTMSEEQIKLKTKVQDTRNTHYNRAVAFIREAEKKQALKESGGVATRTRKAWTDTLKENLTKALNNAKSKEAGTATNCDLVLLQKGLAMALSAYHTK
jgi:hypothetical protein